MLRRATVPDTVAVNRHARRMSADSSTEGGAFSTVHIRCRSASKRRCPPRADVEAVGRRVHRDGDELVRDLPPATRDAMALAPDDDRNRPVEARVPATSSASGVATTTRTPLARSQGIASPPPHSATGRWKSVPTEPRTGSGWETSVRPSQETSPVAPDEQAERTSAPRFPGRSIPSATRSSGQASSATDWSVVGQRWRCS